MEGLLSLSSLSTPSSSVPTMLCQPLSSSYSSLFPSHPPLSSSFQKASIQTAHHSTSQGATIYSSAKASLTSSNKKKSSKSLRSARRDNGLYSVSHRPGSSAQPLNGAHRFEEKADGGVGRGAPPATAASAKHHANSVAHATTVQKAEVASLSEEISTSDFARSVLETSAGASRQTDTCRGSSHEDSSATVDVWRSLSDTGASPSVMPPLGLQEALREDLSGLGIETLVQSDEAYNKELSWLAFNWRVLYMALDKETPLFERLRFVAISARNLDEFFSKRVGALKRLDAAGMKNLKADWHRVNWTPRQQLQIVAKEVEQMVQTQVSVLLEDILPALKTEGLHIVQYEELSAAQKLELDTYFCDSLEPLLTPLAVDPGHPFPFIGNMTLSIAVELRDPVDDGQDWAIVNVPANCPRWHSVEYTDKSGNKCNSFIPVEQVIRANLGALFGGMEILSANFFRVTRNADVARNEEEADDLLEMINEEMRERKFAPFVRLEVDAAMPEFMVQNLSRELGLAGNGSDDVYRSQGLLALGELDSMPLKGGLPANLYYESWTPLTHPRLQGADVFDVIRSGDLLVHHPYHSFGTSTQAFVEAAALDPKVRAIKATLYRTSADSPVISALSRAAEAGKQVAVLVELKARFDEARNVGFAEKLEDAGCNVAYGLVGLKTHCKCTMVVREEEGFGLRTYVHIGTGNYNPRTAGVYTDFGLFSCKPELGKDVANLFKYLTGYHRQVRTSPQQVCACQPAFLQRLNRLSGATVLVSDGRLEKTEFGV
eukprot:TRINITY_DN854_c0_g1_i3.p1 TRINITY_DN854_c0_g1~~TRINITY_DN854_c0_g1_i3.p1  ORF type:complete len:774 (+),score=129.48 TRINITY_DN854_c0_g1_i3:266-2587(+)